MPSRNEGSLARSYGVRLGLASGMFGALQVLVSMAAYQLNIPLVTTLRLNLAPIANSAGTSKLEVFFYFIYSFFSAPIVLTYLSGFIAGLIMLCYAFQAGRLSAVGIGRRAHGGTAGLFTALVSGGLWVALSVAGAAIFHMDGTYSGLMYSGRSGYLTQQVGWLFVQTLLPAMLGLALGSLAGVIGSSTARLASNAGQPMYPPPYPPQSPVAPQAMYSAAPAPQRSVAGAADTVAPPSF